MISGKLSKISARMRIVTVGSQNEVLLFAYLDRKAEQATLPQRASNPLKYPRQVSDVEKYIGADHKIKRLALRLQERGQFTADQIVVDVTLLCDCEHVRR